MNKDDELKILSEAIERLPEDAYLKQYLKDVRLQTERAVYDDLDPALFTLSLDQYLDAVKSYRNEIEEATKRLDKLDSEHIKLERSMESLVKRHEKATLATEFIEGKVQIALNYLRDATRGPRSND